MSYAPKLFSDLSSIVPGGVHQNVSMKEMTRWRVGGPADYLVTPSSAEQVAKLIQFLSKHQIPWLTIGHTSNLLVNDAGIRGVVLQIAHGMSKLKISSQTVWAEGGIWVPQFSSNVGRAGLTGLEHTIGIPGTLGGLVCMNGGSQRKGIGDHLVSCRCVDRVGELFELTRDECQFAYRQSTIQANQWLVLDATFRLEFGNAVEIRREMLKILQERRKKFPLKEPNCGSVFVSDPAMYAQWGPPGAVIERCGLKGRRQGGAEISQRHANFIVNRNGGTAEDILFLIRLIRETAMEQLGCQLNCEVRYVAEDGSVEPAHEVFTSSTMPIITASEKVIADE